MKREIISIDEEKCDGCGLCIPNCHEGALQIIDGKAVLISDLMCDGLGACIGHCPQGALTIEEREAEAYDEVAVMKEMVQKGRNVVLAHMKHLKEHREHEFLKQGVDYLMANRDNLDFNPAEILQEVHDHARPLNGGHPIPEGGNLAGFGTRAGSKSRSSVSVRSGMNDPAAAGTGVSGPLQVEARESGSPEEAGFCGCPGSREMSFQDHGTGPESSSEDQPSALRQWPVQLHLINPSAGYFQGADLLVAADCVAYSMGNFHSGFLRNKSLVIACPKLDSHQEIYQQKIRDLIDRSGVNTLTVMIMEVPCCGGLLRLVQAAAEEAERRVPVKLIQVGVRGDVLLEQWV